MGGNPLIGIDPMGLAQPAPNLVPTPQYPPGLPRAPLIIPVATPGAGAANSARALPWLVQACTSSPVLCAIVGSMIPRKIADHPCEHMNGPPCGGLPEPEPDPCPDEESCPPCDPIVGTIGYRYEKEETAPHFNKQSDDALGAARGWVPTPHLNLHIRAQSPRKAGCRCWWPSLGLAVDPPARPEWVLLPPSRSGR